MAGPYEENGCGQNVEQRLVSIVSPNSFLYTGLVLLTNLSDSPAGSLTSEAMSNTSTSSTPQPFNDHIVAAQTSELVGKSSSTTNSSLLVERSSTMVDPDDLPDHSTITSAQDMMAHLLNLSLPGLLPSPYEVTALSPRQTSRANTVAGQELLINRQLVYPLIHGHLDYNSYPQTISSTDLSITMMDSSSTWSFQPTIHPYSYTSRHDQVPSQPYSTFPNGDLTQLSSYLENKSNALLPFSEWVTIKKNKDVKKLERL